MSATNQYILEKKIARGGMAEIWLCRQIGGGGFQRICAVKRILPHYAEDLEYVQMFRDEAEIGKSLRHANIVSVEGFQAFGPTWGIIMEFVEGSDLRALLHHCATNQMRLTVPVALFIIADAAKGLHYAHGKIEERTGKHLGIIHRDISPQNIIVSFSGEVKITDFGIANAKSRMTDTKSGIVKGKYSYMSPEQVAAKNIDSRSDIFSLGIVLWECLAMHRLFNFDTDVETIKNVHECQIPSILRDLNKDVDQELESIVMRALQRDVNRRYQTASELEREIRRYLSKKYPGFTSEDVARFVSNSLQKKKKEIGEDIRNLLSQDVPQFNTQSQRPISLHSAPGLSGQPIRSNPGTNRSHYATKNSRIPNTGFKHQSARQWVAHGKISRGRLISPIVIAAIVILAGLTGLLMLGRLPGPLAAKTPIQVLATGNVYSAKFAINGEPFDGGRYRKIPLGLRLPPGKYMIQASREGYYSASARVKIDSGDYLKEVPLKFRLKSQQNAIKVTAKWATGPTVMVNVDDGFQVVKIRNGIQGSSDTAEITDLQSGTQYSLTATVAERNQRKEVRCRFVPPEFKADQEALLQIDFIEKKCTLFVKSI